MLKRPLNYSHSLRHTVHFYPWHSLHVPVLPLYCQKLHMLSIPFISNHYDYHIQTAPSIQLEREEKQRKQRGERKVTWTGGTPQADDLWTQKLILLLAGGNQKKTNELKIEPRHSHGLQKYFYGITLWYRLCGCVCICIWKSELVWSFFFFEYFFFVMLKIRWTRWISMKHIHGYKLSCQKELTWRIKSRTLCAYQPLWDDF